MAATYTTIPEVEPLGAPQRSKAKAKAKASRNIVLAVVFVVAAGAAAATAMKAQVSTVTKFSTECENDETFCGYINVKINNKSATKTPRNPFLSVYKPTRVTGLKGATNLSNVAGRRTEVLIVMARNVPQDSLSIIPRQPRHSVSA